jgi:hypothetical protein
MSNPRSFGVPLLDSWLPQRPFQLRFDRAGALNTRLVESMTVKPLKAAVAAKRNAEFVIPVRDGQVNVPRGAAATPSK